MFLTSALTALAGAVVFSLPSPPATIADARDGQLYPIIEIAGMTWLGRNLTYAAGGSSCPGEDAQACGRLGRLYPWNVAMTACPRDGICRRKMNGSTSSARSGWPKRRSWLSGCGGPASATC